MTPNLYKLYSHAVRPPATATTAVALVPALLSYPLRSRTRSGHVHSGHFCSPAVRAPAANVRALAATAAVVALARIRPLPNSVK